MFKNLDKQVKIDIGKKIVNNINKRINLLDEEDYEMKR